MYETAIAVTCTRSQPGRRRRLAIRPITPALKDRMPRTKRCVFAGHLRRERAAMVMRRFRTPLPTSLATRVRAAAPARGCQPRADGGTEPGDGERETWLASPTCDEGDGFRPAAPQAGEQDPEHPVGRPQAWAPRGALEDGQLMPQCEVL